MHENFNKLGFKTIYPGIHAGNNKDENPIILSYKSVNYQLFIFRHNQIGTDMKLGYIKIRHLRQRYIAPQIETHTIEKQIKIHN